MKSKAFIDDDESMEIITGNVSETAVVATPIVLDDMVRRFLQSQIAPSFLAYLFSKGMNISGGDPSTTTPSAGELKNTPKVSSSKVIFFHSNHSIRA